MDARVTENLVPVPPDADPTRRRGIDVGFPQRVLRMSLILSGIAVSYACLLRAWTVAIGLGAGTVVGAAAFVTLAWIVGMLVGGSVGRGRKAALLAVLLLKLPLLGAAIWIALYRLESDPIALLVGLTMPQIVMALKVAGRFLAVRRPPAGGGGPETGRA
jgi:hypothetical protein